MTLQTDVRTDLRRDGRTDGGYNNIPTFSSKSVGIKNLPVLNTAFFF